MQGRVTGKGDGQGWWARVVGKGGGELHAAQVLRGAPGAELGSRHPLQLPKTLVHSL